MSGVSSSSTPPPGGGFNLTDQGMKDLLKSHGLSDNDKVEGVKKKNDGSIEFKVTIGGFGGSTHAVKVVIREDEVIAGMTGKGSADPAALQKWARGLAPLIRHMGEEGQSQIHNALYDSAKSTVRVGVETFSFTHQGDVQSYRDRYQTVKGEVETLKGELGVISGEIGHLQQLIKDGQSELAAITKKEESWFGGKLTSQEQVRKDVLLSKARSDGTVAPGSLKDLQNQLSGKNATQAKKTTELDQRQKEFGLLSGVDKIAKAFVEGGISTIGTVGTTSITSMHPSAALGPDTTSAPTPPTASGTTGVSSASPIPKFEELLEGHAPNTGLRKMLGGAGTTTVAAGPVAGPGSPPAIPKETVNRALDDIEKGRKQAAQFLESSKYALNADLIADVKHEIDQYEAEANALPSTNPDDLVVATKINEISKKTALAIKKLQELMKAPSAPLDVEEKLAFAESCYKAAANALNRAKALLTEAEKQKRPHAKEMAEKVAEAEFNAQETLKALNAVKDALDQLNPADSVSVTKTKKAVYHATEAAKVHYEATVKAVKAAEGHYKDFSSTITEERAFTLFYDNLRGKVEEAIGEALKPPGTQAKNNGLKKSAMNFCDALIDGLKEAKGYFPTNTDLDDRLAEMVAVKKGILKDVGTQPNLNAEATQIEKNFRSSLDPIEHAFNTLKDLRFPPAAVRLPALERATNLTAAIAESLEDVEDIDQEYSYEALNNVREEVKRTLTDALRKAEQAVADFPGDRLILGWKDTAEKALTNFNSFVLRSYEPAINVIALKETSNRNLARVDVALKSVAISEDIVKNLGVIDQSALLTKLEKYKDYSDVDFQNYLINAGANPLDIKGIMDLRKQIP